MTRTYLCWKIGISTSTLPKFLDVKESDPSLRPKLKKLNFVDELEKSQPVAKRTRTQQKSASKVLANMVEVDKK